MEGLPSALFLRVLIKPRLLLGLLFALLLPLAACKRVEQTNTQPLDEAGMWSNNVTELRTLNVSNAEIRELTKARQGGLSDPSFIELIKLGRSRPQPISGRQPPRGLLAAGFSRPAVGGPAAL